MSPETRQLTSGFHTTLLFTLVLQVQFVSFNKVLEIMHQEFAPFVLFYFYFLFMWQGAKASGCSRDHWRWINAEQVSRHNNSFASIGKYRNRHRKAAPLCTVCSGSQCAPSGTNCLLKSQAGRTSLTTFDPLSLFRLSLGPLDIFQVLGSCLGYLDLALDYH